jgi:hypothetical protein
MRSLIVVLVLAALGLSPAPVAGQSGLARTSPFIGLWCIRGEPDQQALITGGAFGLTLRLESGAASTGVIAGPFSHQVVAPQWNLLHGTLSADEESITWSDTSYWTRCRARINLQGTWYANGNPSRPNRINQRDGNLALRNDTGMTATGVFTARDQIAVSWPGAVVNGTISADNDRIDWDNGQFWSR